MAEEAGRAVAQLEGWGLPGCAALSNLLTDPELAATRQGRLAYDGTRWSSPDGVLCPIHLGAALLDRTDLTDWASAEFEIDPVAKPLLLVPFLQAIAVAKTIALRLESQDTRAPIAEVAATGVAWHGGPCEAPVALILRAAPADLVPSASPPSRCTPDPEAWQRLGRFAHRTYAPASEASRAKGAGGDLPDTD